MITLIAAIQKDRGIGIDGTLPWRIPEDLKHFKEVTTGHPIIMGRKTFESIGRALPKRTNIVLTTDESWTAENVVVARTFMDALDHASHAEGSEEIFVIGGAGVYASALIHAHRILLTEVDTHEPCDAFFPEFISQFPVKKVQGIFVSESGIPFSFVEYRRSV